MLLVNILGVSPAAKHNRLESDINVRRFKVSLRAFLAYKGANYTTARAVKWFASSILLRFKAGRSRMCARSGD